MLMLAGWPSAIAQSCSTSSFGRDDNAVADEHGGVVLCGLDQTQFSVGAGQLDGHGLVVVEHLRHQVVGRGVGVAGDDEGAHDEDDRRRHRRCRDPPPPPVDRHHGCDVRLCRGRWLKRLNRLNRLAGGGRKGANLRFGGDRFEDGRTEPGRRRFGNRLAERRDVVEHCGVLSRRLRIGCQHPIELDGLLGSQRSGRAQGQQLFSVRVHHVVSITWRSLIKPSRTRVFAVPSAMPRRSAISTWVNPPK